MAKQPDTLQGTLDLLILKTLERGPNHGFGITLHIQTVSDGSLRVDEGSLYPALHRLERDRVITGSWQTTENGRRARYYRLTHAGVKRLVDAEERWAVLSQSIGKLLRFA
jgi:PadR family transcriptional regulator, regulatory protein PadR